MDRNTRMQARVAHILGQERNGSGSAGTAVSENYGNRNAGPSSSARFKRGGIVGATAGVDGAKSKPRMDKAPRKSGGSCMPKRNMGGIIDDAPEPTGFVRAREDNPQPPPLMDSGVTASINGPTRARALSDALTRADFVRRLEDASDRLPLAARKRGGPAAASKEGTAKDMREDKVLAKKGGMSMSQWEKSAAEKKHDRPKRATGGSVMASEEVLDGPQDIPSRSNASRKAADGAQRGKAGTTVNITLAPQQAPQPQPVPVPLPVTGGPPVPAPKPPPMMPPGGPMPPDGLPMRKHGGRVMAGAGSGLGRLQKIKEYGDKA